MLSEILIFLLQKLQFILIVVLRFLKILFRRRKRIQRLYFNYYDENLFGENYLVVNFRFRNALYYRLGNQYMVEKQMKIFNLEGFDRQSDFVAYGIFTKRVYKLKFKHELRAIPKLQPRFNNIDTEFILRGIADLQLT